MNIRQFFFALATISFASLQAEHLKSLDLSGVDHSTPASEDFYKHVNKGWMDSHPLSPEYSRYGAFNILNDSSNNRVRRIVAGLAATNPQPGTNAFKVSTLYQQGMDSVRRNQLGAEPLKPGLAKIENATHDEMTDLQLWMHKNYSSPLFSGGPQTDLTNSQVYAMYVGSNSLGLGDRDYYLLNDKRNKEVRAAYEKVIEKFMTLAGYSKKDAKRIVKSVLKIETALADSALSREESRNIPALYNPYSYETLKSTWSNLPFDRFFETTMNIDAPEIIIVTEPRSLNAANKLAAELSDRELKDYYAWLFVNDYAPYLSDDFSDATFEFNKVMSGVQQKRPRWKTALGVTENFLGEAIGELYVDQYFPLSSKDYMIGLVENLRNALGKHILHLDWMSDDTKVQALNKLSKFSVKIGYPDKWKDYSDMIIDPQLSYAENVQNARLWTQDEYLKKWGKPVDKTEWAMTPQTINAYYNPLNNEIVFPAGILQAPFFDPEASDAENYGGIGVVIGHEMTHGFDDQGRNFDANGNMVNWWQPEDAEAFGNLTQGLVDQFNSVEILPGLNANGVFTLGENIADQGGLRVAMTAFLDSQKKKGVDISNDAALIDGLTPEQVFYMNYANLWAQNIREAEIRNLTTGDSHSLGVNRVNETLKNIEPFLRSFNIKDGDKMYRPAEERVIIW